MILIFDTGDGDVVFVLDVLHPVALREGSMDLELLELWAGEFGMFQNLEKGSKSGMRESDVVCGTPTSSTAAFGMPFCRHCTPFGRKPHDGGPNQTASLKRLCVSRGGLELEFVCAISSHDIGRVADIRSMLEPVRQKINTKRRHALEFKCVGLTFISVV